MASFRKKGKVWYYRFVDAKGVKRERKGCLKSVLPSNGASGRIGSSQYQGRFG